MNWIIVFIAFAGVVLNIKKHWVCFLFWLISNGYWFVYNIRITEYAQASIYGVFFVLSIYGLISWRKPKKLKANQKKVKQFCRELLAMKTKCKADGRVKINGLFERAEEILEDIK